MNNAFSLDGSERIEEVREKLEQLGEHRLAAWVRWALSNESDKLVAYIKERFLSGQKLNVITGETRNSVAAWAQKANRRRKASSPVYFVRPGIIALDGSKPIPGTLNYIAKWAGTKHEFMHPAFAAFGGEMYIQKKVEANLLNQVEKMEKSL